jgi:hypothetical protein
VLAVGAVGLLVSASAAALVPEVDPATVLARAWALTARRPRRRTTQVLRSVALLAVGAAFAVRPALLVGVAGLLAGAWLVLYGVHELAVATNDEELTSRRRLGPIAVRGRASTRPARPVALPVAAAALTVLALVVTWGAMPASSSPVTTPGTVAGRGEVCEGYAVLCDRRYPAVAFAASHNAMATASDRAWFIPEQGLSIIGQLDDGVRALLIDVWPGFPTTQGRVATARSAYAAAKAQLESELGPETVAAGLRIANAVTNPTPAGPEDLYMCHALCELGATQFLPAMADVRV